MEEDGYFATNALMDQPGLRASTNFAIDSTRYCDGETPE